MVHDPTTAPTGTPPRLLCGQGLTVRVGGRTLLDRVDFHLQPGEVVVVMGENGAGKTTLLNTLSGDQKPTAGAVKLGGRALGEWDSLALARARAVLPQHSSLNFSFSALEVVLMGRSPWCSGYPGPLDVEIARDCLAQTDAAHLADALYPILSGGERARVQLARVLAQVTTTGPSVHALLLDEPTAALDIAHQHLALDLLRKMSRQLRVGVVLILHDLNLASQYADRVLLLKAGRVLATGHPGDVFTTDHIFAAYGTPMAILTHPVRKTPVLVAI